MLGISLSAIIARAKSVRLVRQTSNSKLAQKKSAVDSRLDGFILFPRHPAVSRLGKKFLWLHQMYLAETS